MTQAISERDTALAEDAEPRSRRRWLRVVLLLVVPALVVLAGCYLYLTAGRYVGTENAYVRADMVAVGAEVAGPIAEVAVAENQPVEAGQVLFRIDPAPFEIALARAEAQLQKVRNDIESLKASYRQTQEQLQLARTNVAYAESEFQRQSELSRQKIVSQAAFDAARHNLAVARRQVEVLQEGQAQILAQLGGSLDIPIERHPSYLAAKAARDRAALDLRRTVVRAPFSGIASNKPEPGDYVEVGTPVMSIVAADHVWIEANFKETDLTHVRAGQSATVEIDSYPGHRWTATVDSLAQATQAEFSVLPAQNATGNWVKVVQRIPVRIAIDGQEKAPPLRAGMSASVEIDTGYRRPLPDFVQTALNWVGGAVEPSQAQAESRP